MEIYFENKPFINVDKSTTFHQIASKLKLHDNDYYLIHNGKRLSKDITHFKGKVDLVLRLNGGKGGFGSMLRAIGAQIEKTTNREACRDLSGRRLRDINEEKRLKNWIAAQADREREAEEKRRKKLERLCEEPKHEFKDDDYDRLRSSLPEKVEDAVVQGLKASCSTKRKHEDVEVVKKKKPKLWLDADLSTSDDDDSDDNEEAIVKETSISKEIVEIN